MRAWAPQLALSSWCCRAGDDVENVRIAIARCVGASIRTLDDEDQGGGSSSRELFSIHINGLLVAAAAALKLSLEKVGDGGGCCWRYSSDDEPIAPATCLMSH